MKFKSTLYDGGKSIKIKITENRPHPCGNGVLGFLDDEEVREGSKDGILNYQETWCGTYIIETIEK